MVARQPNSTGWAALCAVQVPKGWCGENEGERATPGVVLSLVARTDRKPRPLGGWGGRQHKKWHGPRTLQPRHVFFFVLFLSRCPFLTPRLSVLNGTELNVFHSSPAWTEEDGYR